MNFRHLSVGCILAVGLLIGSVSTASAQTLYDEDDVLITMSLSTSSAGITALVGGVVLTVVMATGQRDAALEAYLRDNAVAVQRDLHLGAGATTRDLAAAFDIPAEDYEAFASLLHQNRLQLAPHAAPGEVDSVSAKRFQRIVVNQMLEHPVLSNYVFPSS